MCLWEFVGVSDDSSVSQGILMDPVNLAPV